MGYYYGVPMDAKSFRIEAAKNCYPLRNKLCLIAFLYLLITGGIGVVGSITMFEKVFFINGIEYKFSFDWFNSIASLIVSGPLLYGMISVDQSVYSRTYDVPVSDLFTGFKKFGQTLVIHLLVSIFTFLWSLLFIIPGIIKSISYSMAMYVYHDNPTLSPKQCIDKSKKIMDGHKWDYFCLMLSYIGWILLSALTLGILLLWVLPKIQQETYIFYQYVSGNMREDKPYDFEEDLEF